MNEPTIIDKLEKDPTEERVSSPTPEKKENKNISVAIWLPLLMLFVLPVGTFLYFYLSGKIVWVDNKETENQQEEETPEENQEDMEEETNEKTWTGTYLKGELPEGWNFEEKDYELGGKELIFRNEENSEQEYYLAPWYHSTCTEVSKVEVLHELTFLGNTEYLMVADCSNGYKIYMEYPSTEDIRNLGTVASDGIRYTTRYVFDTFVPEDKSKTIEELRTEYAPIKSILENIEVIAQKETYSGKYIGINSDLFTGEKDYYVFADCNEQESTCTDYAVEVASVESLNLNLEEGKYYTIKASLGGLSGAAAGTSYQELVEVKTITEISD